jgi:hypothetical protein
MMTVYPNTASDFILAVISTYAKVRFVKRFRVK